MFSCSLSEWPLFCVSPHLVSLLLLQSSSEPQPPAAPPPALQGIEELLEAVSELSTVEEVMKYLEPERWQVDMDELYKPSWHVLGKSFLHTKKARGNSEALDLRQLLQPASDVESCDQCLLVSSQVEPTWTCSGRRCGSTAAPLGTSQCRCVRSWSGRTPSSGPAASWCSAAVGTVPAALIAATTASVSRPESPRSTTRWRTLAQRFSLNLLHLDQNPEQLTPDTLTASECLAALV